MGKMEEIKKICTKCKVEKPVDCFFKRTSSKDGIQNHCKKCTKKRNNKYHEANKDKIAKRSKKWREDNREIRLEKQRK